MRFTVGWRPTAERKLNEIWNEAADKSAVSQAADAIESELRSRAATAGESRGDEAGMEAIRCDACSGEAAGKLAGEQDVGELRLAVGLPIHRRVGPAVRRLTDDAVELRERAIELLGDEIERGMKLMGVTRVDQLNRDRLRWRDCTTAAPCSTRHPGTNLRRPKRRCRTPSTSKWWHCQLEPT